MRITQFKWEEIKVITLTLESYNQVHLYLPVVVVLHQELFIFHVHSVSWSETIIVLLMYKLHIPGR